MTDEFVLMVLAVLTCVVGFNLLLSFRLVSVIASNKDVTDTPSLAFLQPGQALPDFSATTFASGKAVNFASALGQPVVMAFVSSGCEECRKKLPDLVAIEPALVDAGVVLWVIAMESQSKVKKLLRDTALLDHVLLMDKSVRQQYNPRSTTPMYLLIDHQQVLQASGFMGDDDWQSFLQQMAQIKQEAGLPLS